MSKRYKRTQAPRRQQKVNPAYAGITMISDMPQPRSMPRNYKSYAREGYGGNDTLYKVVKYGIENAAAIPPRLYTDRTMTKEITSHPLLDKLETPNNEQDGVFFRESVLGYYLIAGNSYLYANRVAKSGPPDELWALQPDLVHPIVDQFRGIVGYQYDNWPKEKNPMPADVIGHMRNWNPEDPTLGMSGIEVAAMMIDQQTAARKWNLSLLQNKMVPAGAWTTTAILSPNDRVKLEGRLNEKMAGYQNAGKIPLLDGALEFKPSSVAPSQMDWLESMQYNAGGIANLWNMPPQLIGDTSSTTYDNMDQAKGASYTEYIFPMNDKLYSLLRRWLVPMYPDLCDKKGIPVAYLYYDKTTVEVVQAIIQARLTASATRANTSYMQGVAMLDEAREIQGLPPLPKGAGQVFRLGAVLVPVDKLGDYAEQSLTKPAAPPIAAPEPIQPDSTTQPPEPDDEKKPSPEDTQEEDEKEPPTKGVSPLVAPASRYQPRRTKALDLSTAEEKSAYLASMEKTRVHYEAMYSKTIANYFDRERLAVAKSISSSASIGALAGRIEGAINDESGTLKEILTNLYQDVSVDVGSRVKIAFADAMTPDERKQKGHAEKGIFSDFVKMFGESQLKYLLTLAGMKIKQISTVTLAKVRLELTDGTLQGESIIQLAKRIDSLYLDQIIPNRSMTIAATEVVSSSNYASNEAAGQSGLTLLKVWLATDDIHTRLTHADADGQKVPYDSKFIVGGEELDYPGDPSGSAENVINCRCTPCYERVIGPDDSDDEDSADEKRRKRLNYRKFMGEVLR